MLYPQSYRFAALASHPSEDPCRPGRQRGLGSPDCGLHILHWEQKGESSSWSRNPNQTDVCLCGSCQDPIGEVLDRRRKKHAVSGQALDWSYTEERYGACPHPEDLVVSTGQSHSRNVPKDRSRVVVVTRTIAHWVVGHHSYWAACSTWSYPLDIQGTVMIQNLSQLMRPQQCEMFHRAWKIRDLAVAGEDSWALC